jgi:hypothetical protein
VFIAYELMLLPSHGPYAFSDSATCSLCSAFRADASVSVLSMMVLMCVSLMLIKSTFAEALYAAVHQQKPNFS